MKEIRAFIAIDLPKELHPKLDEVKHQLSADLSSGSVRWVNSDNIHLTLRFLGDVPMDLLPDLYRCLNDCAVGNSSITLRLNSLGCFPNPRNPRVIWLGLDGDLDRLSTLHQRIEDSLVTLGFPKEGRRYHPHLTLGRVKESREVINARLPWGKELIEGEFCAGSVHLIESQLKPSGAVYTIRHSTELQT